MRTSTKIPRNRPAIRTIPETRVFDTLIDEVNYKLAIADINKALTNVKKGVFNF